MLNNKKPSKRPILAILHRKVSYGTMVIWTRHYARLDRAIPRAVQLAMLDGQPGDVIEFAHAEFGFQIATLKLSVGKNASNIELKISKDILPES